MTIQGVPYFVFPGTARTAMEFYHSVFGGDLNVTTFGEFNAVPEGDPAYAKVMHAALMGGAITLAASDADERMTGVPHVVGNHLTVSLWGDDLDEGRRYFEALAEGGEITMPFEPQMWGDTYGQLVDRFGIEWSVNVGAEAAPA